MKNQYFGDINDYRKYGLLRVIQEVTGLRLGVFWMLTPDDGRADGKFITYTNSPKQWRRYDPVLFDSIAATLPRGRHVDYVRQHGMVPGATFFDGVIPDNRSLRSLVIASGFDALRESDLIFFDPDNGIEIKSVAKGRVGSCKYLFWDEIAEIFGVGKSVLIYQHFPREERNSFVGRHFDEFERRTSCESAFCFRTSNVAFFLFAQENHAAKFVMAAKTLDERWGDQIITSMK